MALALPITAKQRKPDGAGVMPTLERIVPSVSAHDQAAQVPCPVCEARVDVSTATVGEFLECAKCHARFQLQMQRTEGFGWSTSAVEGAPPERTGADVASRFQILSVLGRGGQGAVFRVRPRGLARDFALKYLDRRATEGVQFQTEHELAGLLNHPHIVALHTTGVDEGRPYAVYEIVEGQTLRQRIAAGIMSVQQALELAQQMAAGLAHSHEQGVVHRDIKPENILITAGGVAKITDFGIGRLVGRSGQERGATSGHFVGTPAYAPPEQIEGEPTRFASDVYAFGCMLYEMLAGRPPFRAPSLEVLLHHQVSTPARPLTELVAHVPPPLAAVVMDCLEKDPKARPRDGGVLLSRLRGVARELEEPALLNVEESVAETAAPLSPEGRALAGKRMALAVVALALPFVVHGLERGWSRHATLGLGTLLAEAAVPAGLAVFASGRTGRPLLVPQEGEFTWNLRFIVVGLLAFVLYGTLLFETPALVRAILLVQLGAILWGPALCEWVDEALHEPLRESAGAREARLTIAAPVGFSASAEGRPSVALPATLALPRGLCRLTVSAPGRPRRFLVVTEGTRAFSAGFQNGPDGPAPRTFDAAASGLRALLAPRTAAGAITVLTVLAAAVTAVPARVCGYALRRVHIACFGLPRLDTPALSDKRIQVMELPPALRVALERGRAAHDRKQWAEAEEQLKIVVAEVSDRTVSAQLARAIRHQGRRPESLDVLVKLGWPRAEAERWDREDVIGEARDAALWLFSDSKFDEAKVVLVESGMPSDQIESLVNEHRTLQEARAQAARAGRDRRRRERDAAAAAAQADACARRGEYAAAAGHYLESYRITKKRALQDSFLDALQKMKNPLAARRLLRDAEYKESEIDEILQRFEAQDAREKLINR